ncbi:hypothetical protein [Bacillus sp. FJAT-27231]|uniref:hypothetical protein n=1 Tax=Bacillus sp. FJAT-27231 TaxID=1679168 RepID=UPI000A5E7EA1|nr:hypothetical protein [Bacillus sp. FJAT-27231]
MIDPLSTTKRAALLLNNGIRTMKNMNNAATIRVTKIGRNKVNDPKDGNEPYV